MSMLCNAVQEVLAWNQPLDETGRQHLRACDACRGFGEQMAMLDALVMDAGVDVPPGFADRVMARLQATSGLVPRARRSLSHLLEFRSVHLVLANIGLLVTVSNLIRFVLSLLVPSTASGGSL
jgi:predicted anti-sigma-YlaC factor YlaD